VANRFDLGGVNFSVDAACASSLAAVYLAARELADHTSDMAIVGGVDTAQSPFGYLCFAKAQALSARGRCRTFDESADGIAISEGISMMVLKRLEDAERDGDRIYAVIKGVAGSSDGKGRSMTAPRLEGQILALQRAYARAGIRPSTVGLIEAHGTGTALGDASELSAVADVFLADGATPQSCAIGSVKSMVGHTKSAAGVTGLMKVALALYHKTLPATLHVEKPNPKLLEPGTPIFVNTETLPWIPPAATPRRGGVSAFGFGGTNFHAVLEEFQGDLRDPADVAQTEKWPAELYVWNDPTPADLAAASGAATRVSPSAQTRLAIVASSPEDLRAKLAKAKTALESKQPLNDPQGIYLAFGPPRGKVAFLFPGQGSQKTHMLRELALHFPEFRASLEQAEQSLAGRFPKKLSAYIYPPPTFSPEQEKQQNLEITDTVVAQPALGVVEIGLCHALERLGVRPDMTAGHSYGEYAALAAAGVISDSALFDLSESRGRAIKDTTHDEAGTMAAVSADADAIAKALDGMEGITLANHNSPRQTVISGSNAAVAAAIEKLAAAGLAAKPIPVACAFHSPLMEPARERFAAVLARQTFAKPHAAVFSNTLGAQYPEDPQEIAALLASHLVRPVKFVDEIRAMYEQGARVFVEVGPKGVLTGLARQILDGKDARFIQIDSDRTPMVQLLSGLAQLAAEGVPVDAAQLLRGRISQPEPPVRDTGWMVNGLRAFPRSHPPQIVKPLDLVTPSSIPPQAPVVVQAPVALPAPVPAPVSTSTANDAVMLQFQQLMKQVLQAQTTIMTAYLQGAPAGPLPVTLPAAPPPVMVAASPPPPPAPVVAAPPAAQRSFIEDLRRIAAERTGYPPEMLDLDAGIESDLGIDSIKRVEILTALQKLGTPEQQQSTQGIMTKLTGAKTLREIADLIAGTAEPRPSGSAASAPAPAGRDIITELRAVAAERTGYPPEMLDLDAGIESDLGIDSIKRVEILTALQKLGTPEQQQATQAIMTKLTSAKTLREIADLIAGVAEPRPSGSGATRDVITELCAIAAERTGYPPEMLDLDAGIEADLGIDSIKRVEILTALQKLGSPGQQQAVQGIMNKLTSARTLREIADLIAGSVGTAVAAPAPSAAALVPAAAPAGPDYLAELLKIASERTGYEPDMLDLDAGIEADLGIDSIKRVEILTALQQRSTPAEQAQIQAAMEKLTSARTLREIAERIAAAVGQSAAPPAPAAAPVEVPRFILTTTEKPRSQSKPQYYPGRVCLITDDETGLASALADELKRNGEQALLLRHSPDATISAGDVFTTDLADPAQVESLIGAIRQQYNRPIGAIIHLLPLRAAQPALQSSFTEWRDLVRLDVRSLYVLARATENDLKQTGRAGGALFAAITARGGAFGLQPNGPFSPTHFAVADFTKTLALEFTGVLCKVVDLDPTDPNPILRQKLIDELTSPDDTLQVGLPGDRRLTVVPQIAPLNGDATRKIERDWVFLVTGGARGVTAEIARQLAERHQPTLILAGASPLPSGAEPADTAGIVEMPRLKAALTARLRASSTSVKPAAVEAALQRLLKDREIVQSIESLRRTGAKVEYHSVDVRNEAAFGALIDGIYAEHGRLDVVIHGAGIIEDKLIRDKTPESFDRVVHTKADAVYVLSRKLRPESLQCLLLMSSVTAAFGNRAQADYAAANGIMNGLSVLLSGQWPARVVAMNWGPWGSSGMVSEEVRQQFLSRGIQMVPLDGGAMAALREIEAGPQSDPLVAMGEGPWREIAQPAGTPRVPIHAFGSLK
jgi:malonyl CoA-acyl carrier protein transacylase/NAD(P)-dependent dehydrogenase (short-subunit alcohol dehydrogenase family)